MHGGCSQWRAIPRARSNLVLRPARPACPRHQILGAEQQLAFELQGVSFKLVVGSVEADQGGANSEVPRGLLAHNTAFIFTNASAPGVPRADRLRGSRARKQAAP